MDPLEYFFKPKSVAIVGASREKGKVGNVVVENFLVHKFRGGVYPVNPKARKILGLKCYSSVLDIPGKVDLAVVTVPAIVVPRVMRECYEKKVKAVVLITSGFEEIGEEKLSSELKELIAKNPGTRVVGPNCLGIMDLKGRNDSLFLPTDRLKRPKLGGISFISQSGALGSAIVDWAALKGYGMSKFVSYGNAMDVDEADLLEYLGKDPDTKVIVAYLEGVRRGRRFYEIAKRVSGKKPVIVIKGGVTEQSAQAAMSHTGSLAGSVEVYNAAFKQAGIVRADTLEEVFDFARVFVKEPEMKGPRVQIITNGGGYGVLAADSVSLNGLVLTEMNKRYLAEMRARMPHYVVLKNPIDLTGDATFERYKIALDYALKDERVDAIFLILLFQVPTLDEPRIIEYAAKLNKLKKKPLIVMTSGGKYVEDLREKLEGKGVNTFASPSKAANSLRVLYEYYSRKK